MQPTFTPSPEDVERYRELRKASMDLNSRITRTLPHRAMEAMARALGLMRKGVLVLESEDLGSVLMDACLFDWYEGGKNTVERYAEDHPATPGTDEALILDGYLRAQYRLLVIRSTVPGAGVYCRDELHSEDLFLMDIGLSDAPAHQFAGSATRTTPLGGYWMTNGAGLPFGSEAGFREMMRAIQSKPPAAPGALPLAVARALLDGGAGGHLRYETVAPPRKGKGLRHSALRPRYRFR